MMSLLSWSKAQVLTVSDQDAVILLVSDGNNDNGEPPVKSLLKLTVQTFHKEFLVPSQYNLSTEQMVSSELSDKILSFLSNYSFRQTSESGAEYSYYSATPKDAVLTSITASTWNVLTKLSRSLFFIPSNDNSLTNRPPPVFTAFQAELISPASERQIQRVLPSPATCMIQETPKLYESVVKPFVQSLVQDGSVAWVANVVQGKKEKERLLLDHDDYILNIDTKWRSHPDPLTTSRESWLGHQAVEDLYCLAIVKKSENLTSLRDLRAEHLPMLQSMLLECPRVIEQVYGVPSNQLRIFVHYQPQFYHFHVHFTRLRNEFGCQVERAHLLSDIVQNLEMDELYYANRTISYRLRVTDKLYTLVQEAS